MDLPNEVRLVKRSFCPYHRLAAVGASMGVEGLATDASRCHYGARGLRELLSALAKLDVKQSGVPEVLQELVALLSEIISKHCGLRQEARDEARPQELLRGEERLKRKSGTVWQGTNSTSRSACRGSSSISTLA